MLTSSGAFRPLFSVATLFVSSGAMAQPSMSPPTPAAESKPAPVPSEEEIRRALEADTAANRQGAAGSGQATVLDRAATRPLPSSSPPAPPGVRFFQSLNPDLSLIGDFAAAAYSSTFTMTGDHDPKENGFNLQALELAASAAVDPYFRFDSNLTFGNSGVELEEAYGTTLALPANFQVRAGKFLTRFGRFNPTHPHAWEFSDQPLVLGRFFGSDGNRALGVEVSNLLPFLPWYSEVVVSATDARGEGTSRSFLGKASDPIKAPRDLQLTTALKQFFAVSDDLSLSTGLSGAFAPNPSGEGTRTEIYGADAYFKYRPITQASYTIVSLHLELLQRRYHTPGGVFVDSGGFANLFYRFAYRWGAGLGAEYVTAAENHPLEGDPDVSGTQQRYKAALTFWPTEFSRLRLQYDLEPRGVRPNVGHAVFLTVEFAIGAHGAHKF